jgi:hypothetical protein
LLLFLPVNTAAGEWVIIDEIDTTKKPERIRYAKFLKERHYQIMNRIIPELTPDEKEWVKNRKKAITDALNSIKGKNTPMNATEEGRAWLSMNAQYISSTLYLQNELKGSLKSVMSLLDTLIAMENVDDIKFEMKIWSLLVHSLLDFPLKGTQLNQAISALEMNKGIVFPKGDKVNFLLTDMSSPIARGINFYIIFKYFNGKITK